MARKNSAMMFAFEAARLLERELTGRHLTGGFAGGVFLLAQGVAHIDQLAERCLAPLIGYVTNVLTSGNQLAPATLPEDLNSPVWPKAKDDPETQPPMAATCRSRNFPFVVRVRIWPDVPHDGYEVRVDVAATLVTT